MVVAGYDFNRAETYFLPDLGKLSHYLS